MSQQIPVVQSRRGTQQHSREAEPNPAITPKVNSFSSTNRRKSNEKSERERNPESLLQAGSLGKEKKRSQYRKNRSNRPEVSHDGDRQVFHGKVSKKPGRAHDRRLQEQHSMLRQTQRIHEELRPNQPFRPNSRNHHQRRPHQSRRDIGNQQHGKNRISRHRALLEKIVDPNQQPRQHTQVQPAHNIWKIDRFMYFDR